MGFRSRSEEQTEEVNTLQLKFSKFCEELGLEMQLTMAYSPQKNRVVRRENRTIIEMVRTMLYEKRMSNKFWAIVVNIAVYILNRCPANALNNKLILRHSVEGNLE